MIYKRKIIAIIALIAIVATTLTFAEADDDKKNKLKAALEKIAGLEARVTALEEKTTVLHFDTATPTPTTAPMGQTGIIRFVAINHPECVLNRVDLVPESPSAANVIQYDWCPEAQVNKLFIPSLLAVDGSVISISIGHPTQQGAVIDCWTGGGKLFTLGDAEDGTTFTQRGFIMQCSENTAVGMTMQATILP